MVLASELATQRQALEIASSNSTDSSGAGTGPIVFQPLSSAETAVLVFLIANVAGMAEQIFTIGTGPFLKHPSNVMDCVSSLFVMAAFGGRLYFGDDNDRAFNLLMSIGSLIASFRLLYLFSASKSLGPLWITLQYVVWDVLRFLALLCVLLVGFMLAFTFLISGKAVQGFSTPTDTFQSLVWSVFQAFTGYDPNPVVDSKYMFQMLLFCYVLIGALLLPNLLIAMMTMRFEAVQQTARIEWLFSLAQLIEKYGNMPIMPPPLNLLVVVPNFVFRMRYPHQSLYDPVKALGSTLAPASPPAKQQLQQQLQRRSSAQAAASPGAVFPISSPASSPTAAGGIPNAIGAGATPSKPNTPANGLAPVHDTNLGRSEMEALNYRSTRRMVIARFGRKIRQLAAERSELKDKLAEVTQGVEACRRLIVEHSRLQRAQIAGFYEHVSGPPE
jgi:hypothetical protein